MDSMPDNTEPRTIDVADGHVLYTCCGKLDDDQHRNFCEHFRWPASRTIGTDPGTIASVRELARRAAARGVAIDPDGDPAYLVERINTLLAEGAPPTPPESEWFDLPACRPWCTGKHDDDGQYRDCSSEEMFVPQADDKVALVCVESTFNRVTGLSSPVQVRVEDSLFNPKYARQLAELVIRACDLAEADR